MLANPKQQGKKKEEKKEKENLLLQVQLGLMCVEAHFCPATP